MSNGKTQAQKIALWLNSQKQSGRHWIDIANGFPPAVKAGTLCRIAKSNGAWMPKSKDILDALVVPKMKRIFDMPPAELLWRLENRIEMK